MKGISQEWTAVEFELHDGTKHIVSLADAPTFGGHRAYRRYMLARWAKRQYAGDDAPPEHPFGPLEEYLGAQGRDVKGCAVI